MATTSHLQLSRPTPETAWGFRLQGGRDFQQPLSVQRVTPGSIADRSLLVGDVILTINGVDTNTLTSVQSQDMVKTAGCNLSLYVYRPQMNPQYPCQQQQQQQQYVNSPLSPVQCGTNQAQVTENGSELNCMFDDFFRQSDALFQRCLATDATSPNSQTSELIAIHSPASTPASPNRNLLKSPLIPKQSINNASNAMSMGSPTSGAILSNPPLAPPLAPSFAPNPGHTPVFRLGRPPGQRKQPQQQEERMMPDAVINMAAKQADSDRKPFAYVADPGALNEHRDRVRRKPGAQPAYMNFISDTSGPQQQQHQQQQQQQQQQHQQQHQQQQQHTINRGQISPPHNNLQQNHQNYPNRALVRETTPEAAEQGEKAKIVVHNLYNTPMGLYSNNNANSAMQSQTGITNDSTTEKEKPDITQSATYRLIHGLDDHSNKPRQLRRPPAVKAKTFHECTDGGEGEEAAMNVGHQQHQYTVSADELEEVSGYDETSIRYKGGNCPGNAFRMLQNMTDNPGQTVTQKKPHHQPYHQPHNSHNMYGNHSAYSHASQQQPHNYGSPSSTANNQHNYPQQSYLNQGNKHLRPVNASQPSKPEVSSIDDDIVDIKYVGGHIPSRSFRYLQKFVGDDTPPVAAEQEDKKCSVKVVHLRKKEEDCSGSTDF